MNRGAADLRYRDGFVHTLTAKGDTLNGERQRGSELEFAFGVFNDGARWRR